MNNDQPLRALRVTATTPLPSLSAIRAGHARLEAGTVSWSMPADLDAAPATAAVVLLCRLAERLGARAAEPIEEGGVLSIPCSRTTDALLLLELLSLLHAELLEGPAGQTNGATILLEALDRACGAIADRLAAPHFDVVDGIGVFAADQRGGVRLAQEGARDWHGYLALAASPDPSASHSGELVERLGVPAAPLSLDSGEPALLVRCDASEWSTLAPRLQHRAVQFIALRPERDDLFARIGVAAPDAAPIAEPAVDPEAVLAALPDPAATGSFDVELVRPGPDVGRTAALLARSAGMSEARATELVAGAPVVLLSGVSAFVVRSLGVALVRGAGAELRAVASAR